LKAAHHDPTSFKKENPVTKNETALATARTDLAAAQQRVADFAGGESAASVTGAAYAAWRASRADAVVEVDRLSSLVAALTSSVETELRNAAAAAQASMEATAEDEAAAAAEIVKAGLTQIDEVINRMMEAVAKSDLAVAAAQRGRDPTLPRLIGAEARARGGAGLPLKVISEKMVDRWMIEGSDRPIDDLRAAQIVVAHDGRRGFIDAESRRVQVEKRQFREVRYLPAVPAAFVEPLVETLSVPAMCAGGIPIWTPMKFAGPHDVLQQLKLKADIAERPDRRQPITEFKLVRDVEAPTKAVAAA
jgi:hypothetical protein